MKNISFVILFICVILFTDIFAQYGSDGAYNANSTGMGKTSNAVSQGLYGIGINPANLVLQNKQGLEVSTVIPLPHLSGTAGTDIMSFEEFNYYFGGDNGQSRYLTSADKEKLNDLFNGHSKISFNVSVQLLSALYIAGEKTGAFGLSVTDFGGGFAVIPNELINLGLYGNEPGRAYSFNDASGSSWWIRSYSLSYARSLAEIKPAFFDNIAAGISFKIISGIYYAGFKKVSSNLSTGAYNIISGSSDMIINAAFSEDLGINYDFDSTDNNKSSNFGLFPKPAGIGFGLDIGFNASINKVWMFSVAVTDIGSITWDKRPVLYTSSGNISISEINKEQLDSLEDNFKAKGEYISSFSTALPLALRFGTSYFLGADKNPFPGTLLLAFDYSQGFNDMPGNSTTPRFSIGSGWLPLDWLSIRTGFSAGGIYGFNWAFGVGFNAGLVEFDIATAEMNYFFLPNSAKKISVAFGSKWKFF